MPASAKQDYYETLGVSRERRRGRDPQGVPEAGAQVSSRSESGRQSGGGPFQEGPGSLRHPERCRRSSRCTISTASIRKTVCRRADRRAERPASGARTWDSAASISRNTCTRQRRRWTAPAARGRSEAFRIFSASSSRPQGRRRALHARKRHRPRIRTEHRFLAGDQGHAGALEHHAPGDLRDLQRHGLGGRSDTRFARSATARGQVTQMAGAMQFSLTCPRCDGTGRLTQRLSDLPRRRPHFDNGDGGRADSAGRAARLATARGRQGQCRDAWARRRAICTSPCAWSRIRFSGARATIFEINVPVRIDEAGLGAKIEVPTIDGRALLKIPQGTQNGQKFRLREKGVLNSRTNKRGDQIVEVAIQAPDGAGRTHQGIAARSIASCIPKIRAPRSGRRCDMTKSAGQSRVHDLGGGRAVSDPSADAAPVRARRAC